MRTRKALQMCHHRRSPPQIQHCVKYIIPEPITQGIEGFRGRQLLRSNENLDEGMSIALWDTQEALQKYDRSLLRQEAARRTERLYAGDYWVRNFEIKSSII